ncbi:MAG: hypothetical protein KA144_07055 [Xanthomonadaceae bacterium]|nr:hypothetical protein [Xanthomonadaceae bacterium]
MSDIRSSVFSRAALSRLAAAALIASATSSCGLQRTDTQTDSRANSRVDASNGARTDARLSRAARADARVVATASTTRVVASRPYPSRWVSNRLSVSKSGAGAIISAPSGIDCGSSCSADFDVNASVTLVATPAAGQRFVSWSGACSGSEQLCTVAMNAARSATATFAAAQTAVANAATCGRSDVQSAVDTVADGGTVNVPAGNCAWDDAVWWKNKNVKLIGAGKDATIVNCAPCFNIQSTATSSAFSRWRISGMTLRGAAPSGIVITLWDNYGGAHYGWRIDHMRFQYPGAGSGYGIFIGGPTYGLIDHNEWQWGNGLAIIVAAQIDSEYPASLANPQGGYVLSQPLEMGSPKAVYIEDNTYVSTAPGGCAAYDTSSGGGRAVFRYNTVTGCLYYSHWTRTVEIGGVLHEIYRNTFNGNAAFDMYPIRLEAGTGAIFDNTNLMSDNYALLDERRGFVEDSAPLGACDGSKAWDGNAGDPAAPGWPCLGQIGRAPGRSIAQIVAGSKQLSAPLYVWNNGRQSTCRTGGACDNSMGVSVYGGSEAYVKATPHPNGEVDYVVSALPKPGYRPFVYPHPLSSGP